MQRFNQAENSLGMPETLESKRASAGTEIFEQYICLNFDLMAGKFENNAKFLLMDWGWLVVHAVCHGHTLQECQPERSVPKPGENIATTPWLSSR